jgi:ubiquinone/menaquinone biosynthesis C-methylase UbiE
MNPSTVADVNPTSGNAGARARVIEYYNKCGDDYRILWRTDENETIHNGYFDEPGAGSAAVEALETATTAPLRLGAAMLSPFAALGGAGGREMAVQLLRYSARGQAGRHDRAQRRMTEVCAEAVGIRPGDRVLDAGCGVGGAAIWLAEQGARVVGINIQPRHLSAAVRNAARVGRGKSPRFSAQDYTELGLRDATFDAVWGLESICHCDHKGDFLREAFRVLRPGGRLMVADFFQARSPRDASEAARMTAWLDGWAIPGLAGVEWFGDEARRVGFHDVVYRDIRQHVLPSARRLFKASLVAYPIGLILRAIGVRDGVQTANIRAARDQYGTLADAVWTYGIFTATKRSLTRGRSPARRR